MTKKELIAALEKIHGDPEIEVRVLGGSVRIICERCEGVVQTRYQTITIDRINEYPQPEIVVIEK